MTRHRRRSRSVPWRDELADLVRRALAEDLGTGDVTSEALVPPDARARAVIAARRPCVLCGVAAVQEVYRQLDRAVRVRPLRGDGARVVAGGIVIRLDGPARALLAGERTSLNFLQRLSGIATLTAEYVRRAAPHGVTILDTRKTTPGWRALEKYAVRCGGGVNHRLGLHDRVLIKDNHRRLWGRHGLTLAEAVRRARSACPAVEIEIEVEDEADLRDALEGEPDWILLDNMSPSQLRRFVRLVAGRARLEASGGVTLRNVARIAATGVDAISVGALTHSAPAADLGMDFL